MVKFLVVLAFLCCSTSLRGLGSQLEILFPIQSGHHWMLGMVDRTHTTATIYDPLQSSRAVAAYNALQRACNRLSICKGILQYKRVYPDFLQGYSADSGIYVLAFALQFLFAQFVKSIHPGVWRRRLVAVFDNPNNDRVESSVPKKVDTDKKVSLPDLKSLTRQSFEGREQCRMLRKFAKTQGRNIEAQDPSRRSFHRIFAGDMGCPGPRACSVSSSAAFALTRAKVGALELVLSLFWQLSV